MARPKHFYSFIIGTPKRASIHSLPCYVGVLTIFALTCLYGIVILVDNILPTPLTVLDESRYPHAFIAERASWDLKNLTDIGPRVVGSYENEVLAVEYLTKTINSIMQQSHPNQYLEQDIQIVTGSYYLSAKQGVINVYENVQNVVVKLHGKNGSSSVLVNAHFDSVPTSPGNMKVIYVPYLVRKLYILPTQHKWAKDCKVVINMDSTGSGGKIILFQTGPKTPWLLKYYNGVPHPYGQVAGEELFQSGFLPSGTDFRIFRDFGKLVGLDMAFIKDGYRYHTKNDQFAYIPLGSYQHVGDNALFLIKSFSNAPELYEPVSTGEETVYFDILGLYMISYSNFIGTIVNSCTIVLSVAVFFYSIFSLKLASSKATLNFIGIAMAAILCSWILCIIFIFVLAVITDLLGKTMSWYRHPWLAFGLYAIPSTGLSGYLLLLINHENISLNIRCQIQAHLVRLIWTVVLLLGVSLNIRASYALMISILFSSLAFVAIHVMRFQHSVNMWRVMYILFLVPPAMNLMYQSLTTFSLIIPMTGFIGSDKNPDLIIGLMVVTFTLLIVSPVTALTNLLRNVRCYFIFLGAIFILFLVLMFTPIGFPYSGDNDTCTPQRQWILHTSRTFYNETGATVEADAGFFFLNLDRNSPRILKRYVKDLNRAVPISDDCKNYPMCGMSVSHPGMVQIVYWS
uniref:FXNA-like protease n=2 Tax=Dendroctonus ponderosae TaxID=77166 RepID=A0AAR5P1C9_DENPD